VPAAFLGVAALPRSGSRRAALGAAGALGTAAMVALARADLDGWIVPRGARWTGSVSGALDRVVLPAVEAGVPLLAVGWAGLALMLPLTVRPARPAARLVGAVVWCALAVTVHVGTALATGSDGASAAGVAALPGAVLAAALAALVASRRAAPEGPRDG